MELLPKFLDVVREHYSIDATGGSSLVYHPCFCEAYKVETWYSHKQWVDLLCTPNTSSSFIFLLFSVSPISKDKNFRLENCFNIPLIAMAWGMWALLIVCYIFVAQILISMKLGHKLQMESCQGKTFFRLAARHKPICSASEAAQRLGFVQTVNSNALANVTWCLIG